MSGEDRTDIFLSIIINNYNYERFVGEAIESALEAADGDCEIIVVDDGSTDNSCEVIRRYPDVRLVEKENGGQASALNAGFEVARGQYIHFLDADDLLVPDAVAVIRRVMPGKHMVWFAIEVLDQDIGVTSYYPSSRVKPQPDIWSAYFGKGTAWLRPMSGNVFSAALLREIFPLPEKDWRVCADHMVLCLGALFSPYDGAPDVINRYRYHGENLYFSDTLSSLHTHIYEDRYVIKHSTNYRHFFVAGCDALVRVEDPGYGAVMSHWIRFGEYLLAGATLLDSHRSEIETALARLMASRPPTFWRDIAPALYRADVDPAHLAAFHLPPGQPRLEAGPEDPPEPPQLAFETDLSGEALDDLLQGGFLTWDRRLHRMVYSLSQACRFRARMNALSGTLRLQLDMAPEAEGALRLINRDGRIAETVREGDTILADIPCGWAINGVLDFYFVFETLAVPQIEGHSEYDASFSGGYLDRCRFSVPAASLFFPPLRPGREVAAADYLSTIRHLPGDVTTRDGAVVLSRKPVVLAFSLPFPEHEQEWLEVELSNGSGEPAAVALRSQLAGTDNVDLLADRLRVPARTTTIVPVPIRMNLFSGALPEVTFTSLTGTPEDADVKIGRLRVTGGPFNEVRLPEFSDVSFADGRIGRSGLGPNWDLSENGIAPDPDAPAALMLVCHGRQPARLKLRFTQPSGRRERLWLRANGKTRCVTLSGNGSCALETNAKGRLVLDGWWREDTLQLPQLQSVKRLPIN